MYFFSLIHVILDFENTFQNTPQKLWGFYNYYFQKNLPFLSSFYQHTNSRPDEHQTQKGYQKISGYHIRHKQSQSYGYHEKTQTAGTCLTTSLLSQHSYHQPFCFIIFILSFLVTDIKKARFSGLLY